jgi:ABC-type transport system involved in cytochrome bd biosynthesis fused ATPase/permease subunit
VVIIAGFLVSMISFAWNMFTGNDLLYSAFVALLVMFAASTVFLIATRAIAQVLFKHLQAKRVEMQNIIDERQKQEREKKRQQQQAS